MEGRSQQEVTGGQVRMRGGGREGRMRGGGGSHVRGKARRQGEVRRGRADQT
jgi:hypothetical protein